MKKLYSFLTIFCLFGLFFAFTPSKAGAVDVWVGGNESIAYYIPTDSIKWNRDHSEIAVSVKGVYRSGEYYTQTWYLYYFQDSGWMYRWSGTKLIFPVRDDEMAQNLLRVANEYR